MNEDKATEVRESLQQLFETEFKKDMARITLTGAINFDAEKSFSLWFQLYERLRKNYPVIARGLKDWLHKYYAGKTYADVAREEARYKESRKTSGELMYEAILEYSDEDF